MEKRLIEATSFRENKRQKVQYKALNTFSQKLPTDEKQSLAELCAFLKELPVSARDIATIMSAEIRYQLDLLISVSDMVTITSAEICYQLDILTYLVNKYPYESCLLKLYHSFFRVAVIKGEAKMLSTMIDAIHESIRKLFATLKAPDSQSYIKYLPIDLQESLIFFMTKSLVMSMVCPLPIFMTRPICSQTALTDLSELKLHVQRQISVAKFLVSLSPEDKIAINKILAFLGKYLSKNVLVMEHQTLRQEFERFGKIIRKDISSIVLLNLCGAFFVGALLWEDAHMLTDIFKLIDESVKKLFVFLNINTDNSLIRLLPEELQQSLSVFVKRSYNVHPLTTSLNGVLPLCLLQPKLFSGPGAFLPESVVENIMAHSEKVNPLNNMHSHCIHALLESAPLFDMNLKDILEAKNQQGQYAGMTALAYWTKIYNENTHSAVQIAAALRIRTLIANGCEISNGDVFSEERQKLLNERLDRIYAGSMQMIRHLIAQGAVSHECFVNAIRNDFKYIFIRLLHSLKNQIASYDELLRLAVYYDAHKISRYLVKKGLCETSVPHNTALIAAVIGDGMCIDMVTWLLSQGFSAKVKNEEGNSPLHMFAHREWISEILCKNNAFKISELGNEPLIIQILKENGAHIDQINNRGETPLYMAALKLNAKTMEQLLLLGANSQVIDVKGRSLYYALLKGYANIDFQCCHYQKMRDVHSECKLFIDCIELLERFGGTSVSKAIDGQGRIILHFLKPGMKNAFEKGRYLYLVDYLLHAGVNIKARDGKGRTALHGLLSRKYLQQLNSVKAPSSQVSIAQQSTLKTECIIALINLFIENGLSLDDKDVEGNTPLDLLVSHIMNVAGERVFLYCSQMINKKV